MQVNTRSKALEEIYKIYMFLHRSDLNISANFRQQLPIFDAISRYFGVCGAKPSHHREFKKDSKEVKNNEFLQDFADKCETV